MKAGNIVFVEGTGFISRLIKFFDKGKFSHVALAISHDCIIEAEYMTDVVIRDIPMYKHYTVIDLGLTSEQIDKIPDAALKMLGKSYDYWQILGYVLKDLFSLKGKNRLNNPKNLICSELVYTILYETGILKDLGINSKEGFDLTPNQLYDLVKYIGVKTTFHI